MGFYQGSDTTVVAVIDTGVNINHPDLQSRIWVNPGEIPNDGVDNDANGYIDDVNGWDFYHNDKTVFDPLDGDTHGTHVAGTIAAVANTTGVVGVAPNVKIMPLKFIGPDNGYTTDAIDAINYAKAKGVKISNNSWGGGSDDVLLKAAIDASGQVFIAAAGNEGTNNDTSPQYPASFNSTNIISVAAVYSFGGLASFSNFGPINVDVGAPGVGIYSTTPGLSETAAAVYSETYSAVHFGFGLEQIGDIQRSNMIDKALTQLGVAKADPILLVDDDNSENGVGDLDYKTEFQAALSGAGFTTVDYGAYGDILDGPSLATMQNYKAVVWFSGATFGDIDNNVLRPNDLTNLKEYLKNSGSLILSGNDIAQNVELDPLFTSYINVNFLGDEAGSTSVLGVSGTPFAGISYNLLGLLLHYKDALAANSNSTVMLNYPATSEYGYLDGTSMATPHVTGVAALLLSKNPNLTPQQVISLIKDTGEPLASLAATTSSGRMVNAYNALAKLTIPATPVGFAARGGNAKITLTWSSNTEPDVLGYNVYKKNAANTFIKDNSTPVSGNIYVINGLTNGTSNEFRITAIDAYGNESPMTASVNVTAGVSAPVIASVGGSNVSGIVSNDKNPQVVVNGVTVGDYVYLYNNVSTPLNSPVFSTSSSITVPLTNLADGTYNITAKYTDAYGEQSPASTTFTYKVDATPPAPPTINSLTSSNSWTFNITGTAESNSTVKIYVNGVLMPNSVSATGGNFTAPVTVTADGIYSIKVITTDSAGNTSPDSNIINVAVDAPPGIATRNPMANATGVATVSNIEFTFNQDVVGDTVYCAAYPNNVKLYKGLEVVAAAVNYDALTRKVTIDPIANLAEGTTYTVSVSGVKDTTGNTMPLTTWNFTAYQPSSGGGGGGGDVTVPDNKVDVTIKVGETTTINTGNLQINVPIGAADEKLTAKVTPLESKDSAYITINNMVDDFAKKIISAYDFSLTAEDGSVNLKQGLTVTFKTGNTDQDYGFYRLDPVFNTLVPVKTVERKDSIEAILTQPGKLVILEEKMPSFSDVISSNWSTPYINGLAQKNIINGMSNGEFEPNANLTRGQLAKIITLASGVSGVNTSAGFMDVNGQVWSAPFINTAKSNGVINGYADGSFKPETSVTRAELIKMVVIATGLKVEYQQGDFKDTNGHWAEKYIATVATAGIVSGYRDGNFNPDAPVTREEAAKIIAIATGYMKPAI